MNEDKRLQICCVSDKKYTKLLKPFLRSLFYHNDDVSVHVTLVNCDELNDEIMSINDNITINNENIELSTKRTNLVRHGGLLYDSIYNTTTKPIPGGFNGPRFLTSDLACYCSNIRFRVIERILKKGYENVLFMDVDAIVKKNLKSLYNIIKDHDITIMKESRGFNSESITISDQLAPPDRIDWHCGIIGVHNSNTAMDFIKTLKERTENDMWNWDADQDQFNITFNDFKDRIKLKNLPKEYKDEGYTLRSDTPKQHRYYDHKTKTCNVDKYTHKNERCKYSDESYIWCGAGEAKYSNEQYITEQNKWNDIVSTTMEHK